MEEIHFCNVVLQEMPKLTKEWSIVQKYLVQTLRLAISCSLKISQDMFMLTLWFGRLCLLLYQRTNLIIWACLGCWSYLGWLFINLFQLCLRIVVCLHLLVTYWELRAIKAWIFGLSFDRYLAWQRSHIIVVVHKNLLPSLCDDILKGLLINISFRSLIFKISYFCS